MCKTVYERILTEELLLKVKFRNNLNILSIGN